MKKTQIKTKQDKTKDEIERDLIKLEGTEVVVDVILLLGIIYLILSIIEYALFLTRR